MPPSDKAMRRLGYLRSTGEKSRSAAHWMMFTGCRAMSTSKGASGAVMASCDDEPMCRHTTVPSSSHACQKGSQWSGWKLGHPSLEGFSENVTAWLPLAATRRTSAAMSWGSQMGGMESGMKRPG
jgi:hypothetical protein